MRQIAAIIVIILISVSSASANKKFDLDLDGEGNCFVRLESKPEERRTLRGHKILPS